MVSAKSSLTTSPGNWVAAYFDRKTQLTPTMLTVPYVDEATEGCKNAHDSVFLTKEGSFYAPAVREVVNNLGPRPMEAYIKAQLVSLNIVLNLARPMSEALINASAPLIVRHLLDDDCDVTLADLRIIFDRAKMGQFGNYYNGIGLADICGWLDSYIAEKCEEFEKWHINKYKQPRQ